MARQLRADSALNLTLFLGPLLIGVVFAILKPDTVVICLYLVGFLLFLRAKISVPVTENVWMFGPAGMTKKMKAFYWIGYGLMILGLILSVWYRLNAESGV